MVKKLCDCTRIQFASYFNGFDCFIKYDRTDDYASQDAVDLLGHLGTLLSHVQPSIDQHPQVLFLCEVFQPLCPKPVSLHRVVVAKVQDLTPGLVKTHTIDLSPLILAVQIPL